MSRTLTPTSDFSVLTFLETGLQGGSNRVKSKTPSPDPSPGEAGGHQQLLVLPEDPLQHPASCTGARETGQGTHRRTGRPSWVAACGPASPQGRAGNWALETLTGGQGGPSLSPREAATHGPLCRRRGSKTHRDWGARRPDGGDSHLPGQERSSDLTQEATTHPGAPARYPCTLRSLGTSQQGKAGRTGLIPEGLGAHRGDRARPRHQPSGREESKATQLHDSLQSSKQILFIILNSP